MPELLVKADTSELEQVFDYIHGVLGEDDYSARSMIQLDVAIEELFVNIANYAYGEQGGSATIKADYNKDEEVITIVFSDWGIPYNPLQKADPDITLSVEERQIGGLGIYMVKKTMDDISYRYVDNKNELTIKKKMKA